MKIQHLLAFALAASLSSIAPASAAIPSYSLNGGIENLNTLKTQITTYYTSGKQEADVAKVYAHARAYVAQRLKEGVKKPAVVLDVDDTMLSSYKYDVTHDYGYDSKTWHIWEREFKFPAMPAALAFTKWAQSQGVALFYVTGRPTAEYDVSLAELKAAGFPTATKLVLRPPSAKGKSVIPFKSGARHEIENEGYTILAAIGDQWSDSLGGFTEREYKLPNPMYYLP